MDYWMDPPQQIQKVNYAKNLDIFSKLHADVKEKILIHLPIKDAVRTSILSSKWRHVWASIPDLVFSDDDCSLLFENSDDDCALRSHNSGYICHLVDRVLSLHDGPIRKFSLTTEQSFYTDLDRWMRILSRNTINELVIKLSSSEKKYNIPTSFFTCHDLEVVRLHNCMICLPRNLEGFELLHTLELQDFTFRGGDFGVFIASCPQLESLSLSRFKGFTSLKIHSPKLRDIAIRGRFDELDLHVPQVVSAFISKDSTSDNQSSSAMQHCRNHLIQALGSLSSIEKLELCDSSMMYLSSGALWDKVPMEFIHLKDMRLNMRLSDSRMAATTLCLLQSAPMLQILEILNDTVLHTARADTSSRAALVWSEVSDLGHAFERLRFVEISVLKGSRAELAFVKLLLAAAPVLEDVKLRLRAGARGYVDQTVLTKLLKFRRASSQAEITLI